VFPFKQHVLIEFVCEDQEVMLCAISAILQLLSRENPSVGLWGFETMSILVRGVMRV